MCREMAPETPVRDGVRERRLASSSSSPGLINGDGTITEAPPSLLRANSTHSLRLLKYRGLQAKGPDEPRTIRKQVIILHHIIIILSSYHLIISSYTPFIW
jgi:hypothetical protein